jgi:ribosome maturation factor RimP
MLKKEFITSLVNQALDGSENYLIEVKVSAKNKITILIENDKNVAIKDCVAISRFVEQSIDREKEDFELEVSSPGIDQPFKHYRQYMKNIGRNVEVLTNNGETFTGKLVKSDDKTFEIEPLKTKKNKDKNIDNLLLEIKNIKQTKLIINI